MSTSNNRLVLKVPEGSDPFLRDDFVYNYGQLIKHPGYYPCTSTTRPAWGAAQANMLIVESDTQRIMRWTGTAWAALNHYTGSVVGSVHPNTQLAAGASPLYTVASITVPRAARLNIIGSARFAKSVSTAKTASAELFIDGSTCEVGFATDATFADFGSSASVGSQTIPLLGSRVLTAGTHLIQAKISISASNTSPCTIEGVKVIGFYSES